MCQTCTVPGTRDKNTVPVPRLVQSAGRNLGHNAKNESYNKIVSKGYGVRSGNPKEILHTHSKKEMGLI